MSSYVLIIIILRCMGKVDRVLRRVFPGRGDFTPEERAIAEAALYVANSDAPKARMPRTDTPVGGILERGGVRYECVVRPEIKVPADACSGCGLRLRSCSGVRCSPFDREDGIGVWFRRV